MSRLAVLLLLALAGCSMKQMSNDDIIAEDKKCKAADLDSVLLENDLGVVGALQCRPRKVKP